MIADRRQALAARLSQLEVDATLITFLPNVRYLTGFSGSNGQVVVGGAESVFFTDGRYTEQSRAEVPDIERVTYSDGFSASLLEQLKRLGVKRLGFEANNVTVAQLERFTLGLPEIELVPLGEEVERIRWIKDADEIEALNKAQSVTDQAFTDLLERFEAGMTERQAARDLMSLLMRDGADGLAFDSIVAFGENAAEPHHEPR